MAATACLLSPPSPPPSLLLSLLIAEPQLGGRKDLEEGHRPRGGPEAVQAGAWQGVGWSARGSQTPGPGQGWSWDSSPTSPALLMGSAPTEGLTCAASSPLSDRE